VLVLGGEEIGPIVAVAAVETVAVEYPALGSTFFGIKANMI
jgi:hypothetical protein